MEIAAELPPASRLAVAWQPSGTRAQLAVVLALDGRLSRVVPHAREPILAQVRLAWWRDRLREDSSVRPVGEPLLAAIGPAWSGRETALVGLVDGWEGLIGHAAWPAEAWRALADTRAEALAAFAREIGADEGGAHGAGLRWALADLAIRAPDQASRAAIGEAGRALPPRRRLPRALRGLAVLDALSERALARGEPLLADRRAALVALRVGMVGV